MNPVFNYISDHAWYAIWHSDLSASDLEKDFGEKLPAEIMNYHPAKKIEYLASRILMRKLCEYADIPYNGIVKDENGKPHLMSSPYFISISHSYPYVVCMLDKNNHCGIDIEAPRIQLLKIKHKFLNQHELLETGEDLHLLSQYWSAKEALYKIHGKKNLIFSEEIHVEQKSSNGFLGTINTKACQETYSLVSKKIDEHFIVYNE